MLKRDQAQAKLKSMKVPDWAQTREAELARVGEKARVWARSEVLSVDDDELPQETAAAQAGPVGVSGLPAKERQKLAGVLFPKLAPWIEKAWEIVPRLPYPTGYTTRPFRAPKNEGAIAAKRDEWFTGLARELAGHDPDPVWLATWGAHLGYGGIGDGALVLAAAIDEGGETGDEVKRILKESASGQHEIGAMGTHVLRALLSSADPDAWEFVAKMLVAAKREEGLRQSILEIGDEAHPGAFRRLLKLILDEDLARFAAIVRAVDVWFGFLWDSMAAKHAASIIERTLKFLDDEKVRNAAIAGKDPETAYLGLWSLAFEDADAALKAATALLSDRKPERRWVGVHLLAMLDLPEAILPLARMMADDDIRVAARAFHGVNAMGIGESILGRDTYDPPDGYFDCLVGLLKRIKGAEQSYKPLVFPWTASKLTAAQVGLSAVRAAPKDDKGVERILPLIDRLDPTGRMIAATLLAGQSPFVWGKERDEAKMKPVKPGPRRALIGMLADPAKQVREEAGEWLSRLPLEEDEASKHEEVLDRTASDMRTRAISRLCTFPDEKALAAAERLAGSSAKLTRSAGIEMLRLLAGAGRSTDGVRAIAEKVRTKISKPSKDETAALDAILNAAPASAYTLKNGLGLLGESTPHPIVALRELPEPRATKASIGVIRSLDELVERNKTLELKSDRDHQTEPVLLGGSSYWFPHEPSETNTPEQDRTACPVLALLTEWRDSRGPELKDPDGLELMRAWTLAAAAEESWDSDKVTWPTEVTSGGKPPRHTRAVQYLLSWLVRLGSEPGRQAAWLLDCAEAAASAGRCALPPREKKSRKKPPVTVMSQPATAWITRYRGNPGVWGAENDEALFRRFYELVRSVAAKMQENPPPAKQEDDDDYDDDHLREAPHPDLEEFVRAYSLGMEDDNAVIRRLVDVTDTRYGDDMPSHHELSTVLLRPRWAKKMNVPDSLRVVAEKIRDRALSIELERGDAVTVATSVAAYLSRSGGVATAVPALARLGKYKLVRGYNWKPSSKAAIYSVLIANSRPGQADTLEAFAAAAKKEAVTEERLIELAIYAPWWAPHVEHALGWPSLEEAVLWLRAHTKGSRGNMWDDDAREPWEGRVSELTPIAWDSLGDGAVDRAWFERIYKKLGDKRWAVLYEAAKYASAGPGHTRARLFADAMLGDITEKELVTRITTKRHQDAVRALGLLEIKPGDAGKKQVHSRFKVMQEMRRTSRKHGGSMLQASEKRAVEIGMENLARTAGYPDPLRLQWAMEIEEYADLAAGGNKLSVTVKDTVVTLAVDDEGEASLTAVKGGKELKSVPPAVKKDKKVAPLAERLTELRRQTSRVRQALEQAMCRADEFSGSELPTLFGHPILRTMIRTSVFVGTTKAGGQVIGYPDKEGKVLRGLTGALEPVKASDSLRLAHPIDFLSRGDWHDWQRECFKAERVQAFKQVFREVYVPVGAEKEGAARSTRYEGQQVQPRQALALFGTRGWVSRPEEGVQRTFHKERITARVGFMEGFATPADIDGLTVESVSFSRAGQYAELKISEIPARTFSEVMRDLDLVVSVAHRGGVDPEASQSTVEMRTSILRETCAVLALDNVRVEGQRALITGQLGEYAVHLGSGTIHRLPGGSVWVVPVHSQHRGRIFLPFADNDPKAAEVLSKVLMLSRDHEIKDPQILAQLRS